MWVDWQLGQAQGSGGFVEGMMLEPASSFTWGGGVGQAVPIGEAQVSIAQRQDHLLQFPVFLLNVCEDSVPRHTLGVKVSKWIVATEMNFSAFLADPWTTRFLNCMGPCVWMFLRLVLGGILRCGISGYRGLTLLGRFIYGTWASSEGGISGPRPRTLQIPRMTVFRISVVGYIWSAITLCHYLYPLLQLPAALSRKLALPWGERPAHHSPSGWCPLRGFMKHVASFEASSENSLGSTFLVPWSLSQWLKLYT